MTSSLNIALSMVVRDEDIRRTVKELDEHIRKEYIESHPKQDRDWRTYEQEFSKRIREAMKNLDPLIHEAVSTIRIQPRAGRPDSLTLEQRVKLLLIKQLVGESNRMFANMLDVFSMLSGIEVSYKTVERLYSDEEVMMALHNLHVLLLKRKGVEKKSDATGDGTGYSLSISKHYESIAKELKDGAKENNGGGGGELPKRRAFAYSFRLMDISSRMYLAYGSSMKSEREAFDRAMAMLSTIDISIDTVRLDRYYSNPGYADTFDELIRETEWERYGTHSGNPKCANCMVHSGYEASAVNDTFGSVRGFLATVRATLSHEYKDPDAMGGAPTSAGNRSGQLVQIAAPKA